MTYLPPDEYKIRHAIDVIEDTYSVTVSVDDKKKDLVKFGTHTSIGTGWETLAEMQDSETAETFVTGNDITHIVSTSGSDTGTVAVEYHTISGGVTTFGVQSVTLTGTTAKALTTPCFRTSRIYNTGSSALVGTIVTYEGGALTSGKPDDDSEVHALIPAGEQQTQKAQTTISNNDYWIIANITLSVTEKTSAWAEARLEIKPVATSYWRPITQNFSASDASGTVELLKEPFVVVPANHDVRLAVRANTAGVSVAGGFSGYLAGVVE